MKPTTSNLVRVSLMSICISFAAGCVASPYPNSYPQGYPGDNGGGYGRGPAAAAEYAVQQVDLTGEWALSTGGVNRFSRTHDGYYVAPRGGRAVHYIEIGENLYQDANGSGTYEVIDTHTLVWFSNNNRNKQITLYRQ